MPTGPDRKIFINNTIPLLGCSIWNNDRVDGTIGVTQMAANGAVYMQTYSTRIDKTLLAVDAMTGIEGELSDLDHVNNIYKAEKDMVFREEIHYKQALKCRKRIDLSVINQCLQFAQRVSLFLVL